MKRILFAASGDARDSANQLCWPAQAAMESKLEGVLDSFGAEMVRIHPFDPQKGHGFLDSQHAGLAAFSEVDEHVPIIIGEAVWQYSHHVLPGLLKHRAPILTLANWSGQWPGVVGTLNLNGGLTKAGKPYSTLWSTDFDDEFFVSMLEKWLETGGIYHDMSHMHVFDAGRVPSELQDCGQKIAADIQKRGSIMAVFDEGCMGMYNAIIPDELLHPMGFFKERLSQSALFARMQKVSDADAQSIYDWLIARKFTFHFDTDFTQDQVLEQCKMYIAATQMAHESGCESLGIQYQLGLKDTCAASDLVEGMLNNSERPPVLDCNGQIIRNGEPYPHFNEVDECAGVDAVLTNRVHKALSQPPENTLHDVRWGDTVPDDEAAGFVWVFEISGAAPAAHHGGYEKSWGHRQPPMYFPAGGSGLSGIAKPGEIIWSRIFVDDGILKMHIGRGKVVALSENETKRRLDLTTKEWPIMHAKLHGVSKEQLLGNHKANHIQVAYANSAADADRCMWAKACTAHALGIQVVLCGVTQ